ncbi:MAG: PIN domain-containing protein [Deltaproteobacteria bacterium]|nr:PIN domain-containing protein [Deltaproteobacteria bacterium]
MKYKVFVDTNVLLSGIFFEGNESTVLDMVELDLITSEDAVEELRRVIRKKLKYLKERTFEIALAETEKALSDIAVIPRIKYNHKLKDAEFLIKHKKDIPILAAVLFVKPDYFLTGDAHFFNDHIKSIVNVVTAKDFFAKIK